MPAGLSMLSLAASGIYSLTMLACVAAAFTARRFRQAPGHWRTWAVLAVLFAIFIALRLSAAEELLRDSLRASFRAGGDYDDRRAVQAPIILAILTIAGAGALALFHHAAGNLRGRRNVALFVSVIAALAMLFVMALRLASLHAVDGLLYGPLKLNWVIDIGSSLGVMAAAIAYIRLVRLRP